MQFFQKQESFLIHYAFSSIFPVIIKHFSPSASHIHYQMIQRVPFKVVKRNAVIWAECSTLRPFSKTAWGRSLGQRCWLHPSATKEKKKQLSCYTWVTLEIESSQSQMTIYFTAREISMWNAQNGQSSELEHGQMTIQTQQGGDMGEIQS